MLDKIGEILWFAMFFTPVLTIPVVWRLSREKKIYRILLGLGLAIVISIVFFIISWTILFRNGMGPS